MAKSTTAVANVETFVHARYNIVGFSSKSSTEDGKKVAGFLNDVLFAFHADFLDSLAPVIVPVAGELTVQLVGPKVTEDNAEVETFTESVEEFAEDNDVEIVRVKLKAVPFAPGSSIDDLDGDIDPSLIASEEPAAKKPAAKPATPKAEAAKPAAKAAAAKPATKKPAAPADKAEAKPAAKPATPKAAAKPAIKKPAAADPKPAAATNKKTAKK